MKRFLVLVLFLGFVGIMSEAWASYYEVHAYVAEIISIDRNNVKDGKVKCTVNELGKKRTGGHRGSDYNITFYDEPMYNQYWLKLPDNIKVKDVIIVQHSYSANPGYRTESGYQPDVVSNVYRYIGIYKEGSDIGPVYNVGD